MVECVSSLDSLFQPFTLNGLDLRNRIVMAPMTRYFSPGGVPGEDVARYYARRAKGGVALVITEGTYIPHPSAHGFSNVPCLYGEAAIAGWRRVVDAVHAAGGRIFSQLWHAGAARMRGMEPDPSVPGLAPSETEDGQCRAMSEEDIADIVGAYAAAAATAQANGFDGIEIHGAHGYLVDAFLWEQTNKRTDRWGGSPRRRAAFAVEIVRAIRRLVGDSFPISFRWSQFKQQDYAAKLAASPQELELLLGAIADAGVTLFHASGRRFWTPEFPEQSDLSLAGWTRKLTGKPTIAVGSVGLAGVSAMMKSDEVPGGYTFAGAERGSVEQLHDLSDRLMKGEFDLVAVGRSLLADPNWPIKLREGRYDERIAFDKTHLSKLV